MADIKKLVEEIKELKLIEVAELVKALETEFGVSAAASVAVAAGPAAAAVEVEEKTEFDVILKDIGPNKLNVIKVVREITSLGLGEAKALVESAPKAIKEAVSKDVAAQLAEKIKATGATVEVK